MFYNLLIDRGVIDVTPEELKNKKIQDAMSKIVLLLDDMEQWVGDQHGEWKEDAIPVEALEQRLLPFVRQMHKEIGNIQDLVKHLS